MDEHAGALRLMALTLCRPINTCFVPSPAQKLAAASAKVDDLLDTYRRLCGYLRPAKLQVLSAMKERADLGGEPVPKDLFVHVPEEQPYVDAREIMLKSQLDKVVKLVPQELKHEVEAILADDDSFSKATAKANARSSALDVWEAADRVGDAVRFTRGYFEDALRKNDTELLKKMAGYFLEMFDCDGDFDERTLTKSVLARKARGESVPTGVGALALDKLPEGGARVSIGGSPPPIDTVVDVPALVERFDRGAHVTIASGTNTGKSYLARAIAKELVDTRRVQEVKVYSDDPETALATYDPVLGDDLEDVYMFSEDELRKLCIDQEAARKEKKLGRVLVIVDDVSGTEKSATLEMFFKRGRHVGIQVMLLNQMSNKSTPTWAKANSSFILFSMLSPPYMKDLHASMTLQPSMQPKAFADWAAVNVGGAPGTPTRYVFGVYERDYQAIYKVKK
jgi:hypothetical protein